jgi:hypothetical protein
MELDKTLAHCDHEQTVFVGYKVVVPFGNAFMPWAAWSWLSGVFQPRQWMAYISRTYGAGCFECEAAKKSPVLGPESILVDPRSEQDRTTEIEERVKQHAEAQGMKELATRAAELPKNTHAFFTPRQMSEVAGGTHPFHVESSLSSCLVNQAANPFGYEGDEREAERDGNGPWTHWIRLVYERPKITATEPRAPGVICRVLVPESAITEDNHVRALMLIPPGETETGADIRRVAAWPYAPESIKNTTKESDHAASSADPVPVHS